jgi:hypothetical protein
MTPKDHRLVVSAVVQQMQADFLRQELHDHLLAVMTDCSLAIVQEQARKVRKDEL